MKISGGRRNVKCADARVCTPQCFASCSDWEAYVRLRWGCFTPRSALEFPGKRWDAAAIRCNMGFVVEAIALARGDEGPNLELIVVTPGTSRHTAYSPCMDSEQGGDGRVATAQLSIL